jgi:hypothetical protein
VVDVVGMYKSSFLTAIFSMKQEGHLSSESEEGFEKSGE